MTTVAGEAGKMDIARVIRELFGLLKRNFATFFLLALVLYGAPALVAGFLTQDSMRAWQTGDFSGWPGVGFVSLLSLVTNAILQGALIYGAVEDLNGRKPSVGDSLANGLRSFLPIIGLSILAAIGFFFGFLLLVVPGIMLVCAWLVVIPAYVVERPGFLAAFGRSAQLTRGNRWRIFALLLLWLVAAMALGLVLGITGLATSVAAGGDAFNPVALVVSTLINTLSTLIAAAGAAVVYVELRRAREGLGATDLAEVFG